MPYDMLLKIKRFLEHWTLEGIARFKPDSQIDTKNSPWPVDPVATKDLHIRWPAIYQWPPAAKWVDPILFSLQKKVKTERANINHSLDGVILFEMEYKGEQHIITIDYSDYFNINEEAYRLSSLYFKMQYHEDGYKEKIIIPGGFIPNSNLIYGILPYLRSIRDKKKFNYDVYGRFSLEFAKETRKKAVDLLNEQKYFAYEGGVKKVRYVQFLSEVAKSKVCIDMPGNGDFCFRLIDYFAVGACVIAKKHRARLHVPLIDRRHIVYAKDDMSDLVELCRYYVNNDDAREEICKNSREYFDKFLHRDQLTNYYLSTCINSL